jgi:hypothetical protein
MVKEKTLIWEPGGEDLERIEALKRGEKPKIYKEKKKFEAEASLRGAQSNVEMEPVSIKDKGFDPRRMLNRYEGGYGPRGNKKKYEKGKDVSSKQARKLKEPERAAEDYENIFDRAA